VLRSPEHERTQGIDPCLCHGTNHPQTENRSVRLMGLGPPAIGLMPNRPYLIRSRGFIHVSDEKCSTQDFGYKRLADCQKDPIAFLPPSSTCLSLGRVWGMSLCSRVPFIKTQDSRLKTARIYFPSDSACSHLYLSGGQGLDDKKTRRAQDLKNRPVAKVRR